LRDDLSGTRNVMIRSLRQSACCRFTVTPPDHENGTMSVPYDECGDGTEQKIAPTGIMRRHDNQVGISLIRAV